MIQSQLPLQQRAHLTGMLLSRSTAQAPAAEAARAYETALEQLLPHWESSPEAKFLDGVKSAVRFTGQSWSCASREVNNPAIRTAAYQQALKVLAQGPVGSVPAAVATVVLATAERLPETVGKDSAPYIQSHLLDETSKYLQLKGGENARFLLQMADQTSEGLNSSGRGNDQARNQMRLDALGVIATLDEPTRSV